MRRLSVTLLCVLAVTACSGSEPEEGSARTAQLMETAQATAELLAPVHATSSAIIEFSDVAAERASRADVRDYAGTVGTDHRGVLQALDSVARERGAQLQETQAAQDLANSVRLAHSGLNALDQEAFDLAFIRAQVESHRQLLDRIETELLPAAPSADTQQLLSDIRAMEAAHLTRARQILAALLGEAETGSGPAPAAATPPGG